MLRCLGILFLLTSCSLGVVTKDGDKVHEYQHSQEHKIEKLRDLAPKVVSTSFRNPPVSTLDKLFAPALPDLKRIGIIVFETTIQESRSGLASSYGMIYPTAAGKQLMTEQFLTIWDEVIPMVFPEGEYVNVDKMKESKSLHKGGAEVTDHVKSNRSTLAKGDLIFLEKGRATPTETVLNARGMRDLSFVLVPAGDLIGGPKWSEHHKFLLNDVVKELNLDALIVVKSTISWQAAYKDDLSGDMRPEEMVLTIKASTVVPLSRYHERLKAIGENEEPMVTVTYRTHEGTLKIPVNVNSAPSEEKDFEHIEGNLLNPLFQSYRDLSVMTLIRMSDEWRKTF